jgi:hypothetical protein
VQQLSSHVVEETPVRVPTLVPTLDPNDQTVYDRVRSSSVSLVLGLYIKSDLWGSRLDTTLILVMWDKQTP